MKNNPTKNTALWLSLLVIATSLVACQNNSALGVVSNYHWNKHGLVTNNNKLNYHSRSINKITIHHTATQNKIGESDLERLRSARRYHMQDRGWGDIAYHYLIASDGTIYQGRSADFVGGSSTDYGTDNNLLIAMIGNFEVENPSYQALESLKNLVANRALHYRINPANISTHRHHASTLCPGVRLQHWFDRVGENEILHKLQEKTSLF
ncbi:peptidoglycan recognition protein family protein [Leucothrix arctica]|uniref:peptidoglycan recognition protein family protein n=1 Tax=Leucothrix arctica TaxID=1481894 RepID=UPI001304AB7E|nr:peptidoglycan recognition family protein [Leucothrix arctica]